MAEYRVPPGQSITAACVALVELADATQEPATGQFNGIMILAAPGESAAAVEQAWSELSDRRRLEWEQSPEGRAARVRQAEATAQFERSAAEGLLPFAVVDEKAWATWQANNSDGYGLGALRFAARWANYMEARIAKGDKLPDIAQACGHEADLEGITGFMYGAAVSVLASCWEHGEALRRWHNKDIQLGTEGDEANAKEGAVLNPALLGIR